MLPLDTEDRLDKIRDVTLHYPWPIKWKLLGFLWLWEKDYYLNTYF